ncbi:unnamed protein product [Prunus armeniaca]|uniref:Uncharacterized protein n=1 Tax=Prunus armeniaca TaxID=36596 RepID=A0A6J5XJU7_PRUAR|nr:unnamed protein product [Prunus armeniaca]CAB4314019.1 unnamed protein product [Prunus armeniaca]
MPIRPSSSRLLIVRRENEPPSTTLSPVLSPQTSLQAQFVYIDRDGDLGGESDEERGGDEERESALVGKGRGTAVTNTFRPRAYAS